MKTIDLVMDAGWGSSGKGGICGWLAKRRNYDTAVCSYGTQAGHVYNDSARGIHKMLVQQLPTAISGPTVKTILIGPGAIIHAATLQREIDDYLRDDQQLFIHEHACVLTDDHAQRELQGGMTNIGSTAKGVGAAVVDRIMRNPDLQSVAKGGFKGTSLEKHVVDRLEYSRHMSASENMIIEGAQGFSLSLYHGDYPYVTSRDVTPWQICADVGLPFALASKIQVYLVARTYPIRVNNRTGTSGPAYPGQAEITWESIGQKPELTTVTKLPRRIFEFSKAQLAHAMYHCAGLKTQLVLTFADYCTPNKLDSIVDDIESMGYNVNFLVSGPDDSNVKEIRNVRYE